MCSKFKHRTQFDAFKHIDSLREKDKNLQPMGVYYCASCNAYHVTRKISKNNQFNI